MGDGAKPNRDGTTPTTDRSISSHAYRCLLQQVGGPRDFFACCVEVREAYFRVLVELDLEQLVGNDGQFERVEPQSRGRPRASIAIAWLCR